MKKTFTLASVSASITLLAAPLLASAQSGIDLGAIRPYSNGIIDTINQILVPVLMAVALVVFLWGVYKYFILGADNESEKGDGRKFAMWGIVGFVVIFSVWGLVAVVINTFGFGTDSGTPRSPVFEIR